MEFRAGGREEDTVTGREEIRSIQEYSFAG